MTGVRFWFLRTRVWGCEIRKSGFRCIHGCVLHILLCFCFSVLEILWESSFPLLKRVRQTRVRKRKTDGRAEACLALRKCPDREIYDHIPVAIGKPAFRPLNNKNWNLSVISHPSLAITWSTTIVKAPKIISLPTFASLSITHLLSADRQARASRVLRFRSCLCL